MILKLIIAIAIFLLYQYFDAGEDVAIEQGNRDKWHGKGTVVACLFIIVLSYALFGMSWWTLITIACSIVLRLLVFNIFHNLIKGDWWGYVGTTAKTDKLIRKWFPFINFDR